MARLSRYPSRIEIPGETIVVRTMTAHDKAAMLRFAQSCEADDLLFLRSDITQPEVVDEWIASIEAARRITLLATANQEIVGYASLSRRYLSWMRHIGELRVLLAAPWRRRGLGTRLTGEILSLAASLGLRKVVAQAAREQIVSARAMQAMGFRMEALLADWVVDRDGRPHDLTILSHDLHGHDISAEQPGTDPGQWPPAEIAPIPRSQSTE
jgi:RimJ/RimL family protein N-acetyltransferase